jgi:RND superfamily putative drug exporter
VAALADLALRRPRAVLVVNLALLAAAVVIAAGAPGRLGAGSVAIGSTEPSQPDLVVATTGSSPVRSAPYRVALRVISAQVRSDPGVAGLRRGPVSPDGRSTSLIVSLVPGDDADRQRAAERIEAGIDPGPLRVTYGGEIPAVLDARHDLSRDLWKLELGALALVAVALAAAQGPWLAIGPVLCAATAIAGTLAGLRIADAVADVSLVGFAPAAVLGLALGVEAACLLLARFGDEAVSVGRDEAIRRAVVAAGEVALPVGLAATAATAGLFATTLGEAASMVLACVVAAILALASALLCVPALLALGARRPGEPIINDTGEPRLAWAPRGAAGLVAGSRARTALVAAVVVAVMAVAALPLLHASGRPFSAADLPPGSEAAKATEVAAGPSHGAEARGTSASGTQLTAPSDSESLFSKLPLAAAVSAAAIALVLGIAFSPRAIPVAIVALLPAGAACGLCVLVFQDGHLASAIGQRRQGALEIGAVASLLAALAAISASRAVIALRAVRGERALGLAPVRAAETAAAFTVPAAILATLAAGAGAGVLAGTDLYPAREFGLAVAAGLLIDLVLVRVPLVAAIARWGGSD